MTFFKAKDYIKSVLLLGLRFNREMIQSRNDTAYINVMSTLYLRCHRYASFFAFAHLNPIYKHSYNVMYEIIFILSSFCVCV